MLVTGSVYQLAASLVDSYRYPPPGQLIDMGGYSLHIHCQGPQTTMPIVVMEAGMNEYSLTWSLVTQAIMTQRRVCVYDRAGLGWSQPGQLSPDASERALELRTLLHKAEIHPPYLLVGHSLGAAYSFRYLQLYPDEVAGLVMVDPGDNGKTGGFEKWIIKQGLNSSDYERFQKTYTQLTSTKQNPDLLKLGAPLVWTGIPRLYFDFIYKTVPAFPESQQAELQSIDRALRSRSSYIKTANREMEFSSQIYPAVYLPDVDCGSTPIVVLSAHKIVQYPNQDIELVAQLIDNWLGERHAKLAACSDHGQRLVIENSGHYIQIENPAAVIDAIENITQ